MYKKDHNRQSCLTDFNQPIGLKMDPDNRWVKKAETIPWDQIEEKYAELFPSSTGMPAKPLRMALGSLLIQKKYDCSDRELVQQIMENPYLQYFVGLPGFTNDPPYVPSLLVEFRKRLTDDILGDINEMIIDYNTPDKPKPPKGDGSNDKTATSDQDNTNSGTMILDATCAPSDIEFPQDISLLNVSGEHLESMTDELCYIYDIDKPRMYRKLARKDYLNIARSKKRTAKKIHKAIRKQLQYVRRDLNFVMQFTDEGKELSSRQKPLLETIKKLYEQQKYMYDNNVHCVPDRIVSISQPYIRPIVRGKAASPVEFGAKFDLSLDENGLGRIEKLSFDAYNESEVLMDAVERYKERTGRYPERVLADKIYRNRSNLQYCKRHGIRLSGSSLGRPKKDPRADRKLEYIDNADRVAVERAFSLAKRAYSMGLIRTKLDCTTKSSIALSILAMNIDHLIVVSLRQFSIMIFSRFRPSYRVDLETEYIL